jgi:molybdopterin-guanine dinucleotide biosynthesis protein A
MGADKALLTLQGRPLVLRAADVVGEVCGNASIVGDPLRYSGLGLPVIEDNFRGAGPLAGIEAALACTSAEWNLIVACDMPALDSAILEPLFGGDCDCAVPMHEGDSARIEPLCAVYRRSCHAVVHTALASGVRKISDVYPLMSVRYVAVRGSKPFINLNTPDDMRRYVNG